MYQTLISVAEAKGLNGNVVFVDCRHQLGNPAWGSEQYDLGHLPQARFVHVDHDLSAPIIAGKTGRHPLPTSESLITLFGKLGIGATTQVVAYDQDNGMFAARLWWLLRAMGHKQVAVLDGGYAAWVASGGAVENTQPELGEALFNGQWQPHMVDSNNVLAHLGKPNRVLIDARLPSRFKGLEEPIDTKAGHIPGAINLPFNENLEHGFWRSKEDLKARFEHFLDPALDREIVCYCGSGITACHNILAFAHAGLAEPLLYAGSWSEWIVDDERPIAMKN
ncbi:sulfurtransferase [Alkanindiges illinoisensis]|uniref:sulfurtransferase n=1 Tax=Alkanindiges illinoisensis TaxID=197183 RepID=UPI000478B104|nr:sulfurtransferase [Alkanindiges illinoisensis]